MQVTTEYTDKTNVTLTISGDTEQLAEIKQRVLKDLAKKQANVPGFRKGKVPTALLEKQLDQSVVQSEFMERAINDLLVQAITNEKLRTVSQPKVDIKKFVPFTVLEFTAKVEVVGKIKLGDYKKVSVKKTAVSVTDKDVDEVIERLKLRDAEKKDVDRAAKNGDQVWIDFAGIDSKTKKPVAGADGKDYPLALGSSTFIPGFEPEIVGMKAGDEKAFDITFPKNYGVKALQSKPVTFTVTVKKVQEVVEPEIDDAFAKKVGPFSSLQELKEDIKQQVTAEREQQAEREYENELITKIADKTDVAIPKTLVEEQIDRMEQEERQNLVYRGQTWQEHLEEEGITAEQHREQNREQAELRVKAGFVLSEIAEQEGIDVTSEEFDAYQQMLKEQYQDPTMRAEIEKPENQRDLVSRILTQKTLQVLKGYNTPDLKKPSKKD